ncbi:MAG TPA: cation-translocating P-type ATPase, partial [Elusimicrobiota bacterium]|nr:cation-translocating P-type ATPase [Elusimicrobiota bacterium]
GVNDAPALKAADIGVAMGERGTDVAREAAGLVLLHDDFASLVGSIAGGRRVFDNLKKGMAYILAIHVPIAGLSLASVFLGWPLVLLPIHIAFLHLVIDPACSVAFEAEPPEPDAMQRPPRKTTDRLFGWDTLGPSLAQGVSVFAAVFAVFALALRRGQGELDARALAFTTLMAANAGLILANRSWTQSTWARWRAPNRALWAVVGGSALFLAVVLSTPLLRRLFHFSTLHTIDIAASVAVGTFSVFLVDWTAKRWARRRP